MFRHILWKINLACKSCHVSQLSLFLKLVTWKIIQTSGQNSRDYPEITPWSSCEPIVFSTATTRGREMSGRRRFVPRLRRNNAAGPSVRPSVVCSVCWTFVSQRDPLLTIDICRRGNALEGLGPLLVLKFILSLFIEVFRVIFKLWKVKKGPKLPFACSTTNLPSHHLFLPSRKVQTTLTHHD